MSASGSRPPASVGILARPPPFPPDPPDPSVPSAPPPPAQSVPSPPSPSSPPPPTVLPLRAHLPDSGAPSSAQLPGFSAADLLASYLVSPKSTVQIPNLGTVRNPSSSTDLPSQSCKSLLGSIPSSDDLHSRGEPQAPAPPLPKTASWADKAKSSTDKSLKRMSSTPPTISPDGIPRVMIPDEVFQRGAQQHKDFVVGRFFGRVPAFKTVQSVLNYLWGKGNKLEIHMIQSTRSVLVRIPSDYIREKVLKKRIWYVDTAMFHVAQWSDGEVADTSSLEAIPIWAHLIGVPFDLMTNEGLGWIADALGDPKEMDDWTKNLSSLSVAHVKVEADATKPFPSELELVRQNGAVFRVKVEYPWLPPTCSHCKELGHIVKDCLKIKRQWVPVNRESRVHESGALSDSVVVTIREPVTEPASGNLSASDSPDPATDSSAGLESPPPSDPPVGTNAVVVGSHLVTRIPPSAEMDIDSPPPLPASPPAPSLPASNLSPQIQTLPPDPLSPISPIPPQNYVLALAATVMPKSSIKPPSSSFISSPSPYQISLDPLSFPPLCSENWESPKRKSKQFAKHSHPPPSDPVYFNPFASLVSSSNQTPSLPASTVPPPPFPPIIPSPPSPTPASYCSVANSPATGALLAKGASPKSL